MDSASRVSPSMFNRCYDWTRNHVSNFRSTAKPVIGPLRRSLWSHKENSHCASTVQRGHTHTPSTVDILATSLLLSKSERRFVHQLWDYECSARTRTNPDNQLTCITNRLESSVPPPCRLFIAGNGSFRFYSLTKH